jgi:ceramide glucosyltransferase
MALLFQKYLWLVVIAPPLAYYLLCLYSAFHFRRQAPSWPTRYLPPVSVLKPVGGLEHSTYENFASFCHQDYPLYEILFCVNDETDSAVPVIERIIRDFPDRSIRLLIGRDHLGLNPKADKLCRLVREAKYDLFVTSDSDVRVGPGYLRSVAAPFRHPQVGAVSTFFQGQIDGSFVSHLQSLSYVADFWAQGMVSYLIEKGFKWGTGATMAIPRDLLAMIGGYESIVDYHSDDFRIAQALTSRGYRVEFASEPVSMVYPPQSFRSFIQHQVLWSIRLRRIRPQSHFGLLFTFGLPWAILAAILAGSPYMATGVLAGYLLLRCASILAMGLGVVRDPLVRRNSILFPVWDALAFGVWIAGLFRNRVHWRGREYLIEPGGRLTLPPAS